MLYEIFDDTDILIAISTHKPENQAFINSKDFYCYEEAVNIAESNEIVYQNIIKDILQAKTECQHVRIINPFNNISCDENDILDIVRLCNKDLRNEKLFLGLAEVIGGRVPGNKNDY